MPTRMIIQGWLEDAYEKKNRTPATMATAAAAGFLDHGLALLPADPQTEATLRRLDG